MKPSNSPPMTTRQQTLTAMIIINVCGVCLLIAGLMASEVPDGSSPLGATATDVADSAPPPELSWGPPRLGEKIRLLA